ncbi:hypothetical protein AXF42_Ash008094 [Apostasia shenzhenica]|uniref:Stress response protein nst1 n=1 Tax=Apostasia shenzhenica TaxID=1088818 RepID=A0A2I0A8L7_9ASPA|nr:hypothetical protein AXF42_Ash008094 [Apostasia shenzhenica]
MCILCVVQRWSRRVATMLPWLVIPLIILWALSQLLPPALRFEITSPRLACVLVLLATLFWYEILMPHLSSWRARRAARLRERRRTEALELQKLRKTATRRCRNCHMPYRDQNPGGGRFMCSYCGHISKRPALDIPGPTASPGIISDFVGKNGWLCDPESNANWTGPIPKYWVGGDHLCSTERSYSGVMVYTCKLLSCFFVSVRWLCGKLFRFSSSGEDSSSDSDHRGLSSSTGENGGNFQESRGEKARRKAEEKRQARLEKEMLEEEERKQREEVARLVEERRKLRDEKLAAETERLKGSDLDGDKDRRREMERRRRDRRKDKDKASSKSNSDGEELEKRISRESERKREFEKKGENERRDSQKAVGENYKSHASDGISGSKVTVTKPRYFDRMKGTFLSSSSGFGGSSFFGRRAQNSAAATKFVKPTAGFMDQGQNIPNRRDALPVAHVVGKSATSSDKVTETNLSRPATTDVQPKTTALKKSWHQLFSRSSAISPFPDANSVSNVDQTGNSGAQGSHVSNQNFLPEYPVGNQNNFGQSLPFLFYPSTSSPFNSGPISHIVTESAFPPLKEPPKNSVSEDAELFEDPCYVPDPISLLGPVSESLDNFPLDLDAEVSASKREGSPVLKNVSTFADGNKLSPIESPLSKSTSIEEQHTSSDQLFTPRSDVSGNIQEQSSWQMWGSPLAQDGLGLIGCPSSWFSPLVPNNSQPQDAIPSLSQKPIAHISSNNHTLSGISAQHSTAGNHQNGGTYSHLGPSLKDNGIWVQNSPFQSPFSVDRENHLLPLDLMDNITQSDDTYSRPNKSTAVNSFETLPANSWSNDLKILLSQITAASQFVAETIAIISCDLYAFGCLDWSCYALYISF